MTAVEDRFAMPIWTIYDRPSDYPHHFVVRRWNIADPEMPSDFQALADSLEDARALIPKGLVRINRNPGDDERIVESWL